MLTANPGGIQISKTITLAASGGSESLNCFTLTGSVWVRQLWGVIQDATSFATCTAASFILYEATGPSTNQLTKNDGVLSAMAVGTVFAKVGLAGVTFGVLNNAAGAVLEPGAAGQIFSEFMVTQRTGAVVTTIQFQYTTAATPIIGTAQIYATYTPLTAGSKLIPA